MKSHFGSVARTMLSLYMSVTGRAEPGVGQLAPLFSVGQAAPTGACISPLWRDAGLGWMRKMALVKVIERFIFDGKSGFILLMKDLDFDADRMVNKR